ncbi:MAG TPA: PDZ domain-containing protein, partial [Candidatus Pelagibacter sp.]|nr:PDZ domain-containing protein [Candidatus Pelagibacter sp.]
MNYLIPFLILITIVVFIHEYGHYYFAKKYGVGITDFSIGFGREIFGWNDKSGTRWKICWIPLGGYVKFFGDRNVFSQSEQQELIDQYNDEDKKKLFILKPLYQRAIIVAAGPLANFLLAILIFTMINLFIGKDMTPAIIDEVQKDSPAFVSGLKKNDKILFIDDRKVESILEVSTFINISTSEQIEFKILRNDQELSVLIKPNLVDATDSLGNPAKKRMIGIKLFVLENEFNRQPLGPSKAIYYSLK